MATLPTSSSPQSDLQLEIAHLLLIDIVGYSKLLVNEQIESVQELARIVRITECFRNAEESGRLIRVPTGDGMALLFFRSPEEPVRCALEISEKLKENPDIQLRMGIHSGPVNQVRDVNDTINVAGTGINIAQRVMDCGDAGHILLSKHVADDLAQYRHWRPYLHDFGECEVKHGLRLHIVNLCKERLGNPALPEKLTRKKIWQHKSDTIRPIKPRNRHRPMLLGALSVATIGIAVVSIVSLRGRASKPTSAVTDSIPEKSIAVLPFENLSDDKQNAYFTDGVQDEILNDLAKVADLKVISRTSVMQYKGQTGRNLREIAKALGVANILEGSVQRSGNRVRVSAQLIDARNDLHIWAEHFDRDVADVFAIESELAEKIVSKLETKLSSQEKADIEQLPTHDLIAYDLYAHAKTIQDTSVFDGTEHLAEAARLLESAVKRDPNFFLAYCLLAAIHDELYFFGVDRTPDRLALAEATVRVASQLQPDAPESHIAAARHWYWGYRNYERAKDELSRAAKARPNEPLVFELLAFIDRRQGKWAESTAKLQRALELDPHNLNILQAMCYSYEHLRHFSAAADLLDRAMRAFPTDARIELRRAAIELWWHANSKPLHAAIQSILERNPERAGNVATERFELALIERDWEEARRALSSLKVNVDYDDAFPHPRSYSQGLVSRFAGDKATAEKFFTIARAEIDRTLREQPDYAEALSVLALIDAALEQKDKAISEAERAQQLLPLSKDSVNGEMVQENLALVYAWTGQEDLALNELETVSKLPGDLNYGSLRLNPCWDQLRDHPRFGKVVASLAPEAKTK